MKTQSATRKSFRREGEDKRREDLIAATLQCVAENGLSGATVREIALRADVTPGLI
ncbi:MAG: TetR family transcriptional regulator, partial [Alphaproteobacteria bacterium]